VKRTDRLYAIVEELRAAAPRPRTVAQLAARLDVTERTVYRDLLALLESGVPLWSTPGPGGGYQLDPKMTLPPINFTTTEAMAIAVALSDVDDSPFASSARSAMQKVAAVMATSTTADVRRLARRVRTVPSRRQPDVRAVLERAVVEAKVVRLGYRDRAGVVSERDVEPHSFVAGGGSWYLLGWCRLRKAGRGFRLDRITSALLTDEASPDRDFEEVGGDLVGLAVHPDVLAPFLE
jgi:predicted DNA-binding transcriptional regulator YafY